MRRTQPVVIALVCTLLGAAACARRAQPAAPAPVPPPVVAETPPAPPPVEAPAPPATPELSEDEIFARKTLEQLNAERPLADLLFRVDDATVDESGRTVLERNAAWLRRWPSTRITVEGHADERGTTEYNLALGERRARAAREYLAGLGVDASRVLATSKGEEQPVCTEQDETCWRQNRRAHFLITAK